MDNVMIVAAHDTAELTDQADQLSRQLDIPLCQRNKRSLVKIVEQEGADALLVVRTSGLEYYQDGQTMSFHPGMATLRSQALQRGERDHMVEAMGLQPGDRVLDCTLGMATDAIVASFVVGEDGIVVGLESSRFIATIVARGLQIYEDSKFSGLTEAMRRVEVVTADHLRYLRDQCDRSLDVVYFDPMFRQPVSASSGIGPLRALANHHQLTEQAIEEACRVARRRVVVKERQDSNEYNRLGITKIVGGRYSSIAFGVIDCE